MIVINKVIKYDSISKLGYFGPNLEYIYLMSHMETLAIHSFENAEKLCSYGDIRASSPDLNLEYCIDLKYDVLSNNLFVVAGSRNGNFGILEASMNGLNLVYTLNGGHEDIIRGVCWDTNVLFD